MLGLRALPAVLLAALSARRDRSASGLLALACLATGSAGWARWRRPTTSGDRRFYHTGVERHWWPGPASCSTAATFRRASGTEQLLDQLTAAPLVRCDEIPWRMFGLSMASYNVMLSLCIALLFIVAIRAPRVPG